MSENPGYVTITLEAINYAPSVVGDLALGTNGYSTMNTPLSGNLQSLGSDIETAQADLVWHVATQAAHGTVTIDANGDYVYTPNHGYTGWDTFQYQVSDASGAVSNVGTAAVFMQFVALPTVYGAQPELDAARSGGPDHRPDQRDRRERPADVLGVGCRRGLRPPDRQPGRDVRLPMRR